MDAVLSCFIAASRARIRSSLVTLGCLRFAILFYFPSSPLPFYTFVGHVVRRDNLTGSVFDSAEHNSCDVQLDKADRRIICTMIAKAHLVSLFVRAFSEKRSAGRT